MRVYTTQSIGVRHAGDPDLVPNGAQTKDVHCLPQARQQHFSVSLQKTHFQMCQLLINLAVQSTAHCSSRGYTGVWKVAFSAAIALLVDRMYPVPAVQFVAGCG